ncbi:MAG TPA: hypothetical protein VMF61_01575 [Candidatus Acidoferrales bacterium]|nr:hypothetical protein [Candidatus Acidoferrales bacterium]
MIRSTSARFAWSAVAAIACFSACGRTPSFVPGAAVPNAAVANAAVPARAFDPAFDATVEGAGAAPPPVIAHVTPAPGYPTPPPLDLRLVPPTPIPVPAASAKVVQISGKVGASQLGGKTMKGATASALLSALPTPEPDTLVFATITGYTSDGIRLHTQPFLGAKSSQSVAGVAPVSGPKIPANLVVRVNGTTIDGVPGGFASIRTGDKISTLVDLRDGSEPAAKYFTDFEVLGKHVKPTFVRAGAPFSTTAGASEPSAPFEPVLQEVAAAAPPMPFTAAPVKFFLKGSTPPYSQAVISPPEPAFPYPIKLPFGSIYIQWEVSASFGETTNYPLQLVDETAKYPWTENVESLLPVAVLNDKASSPTFTVDGGSVVSISAKLSYSFEAHGKAVTGGGEYLLAQSNGGDEGDPGLTYQSTSESKLLVPKATATLSPTKKASYDFNLASAIEDLVGDLDPSAGPILAGYPDGIPLTVTQYVKGTLQGALMTSDVAVTNAKSADKNNVDYYSVDNVPLGIEPGQGYDWTPLGSAASPSPNDVTLSEPANFYLYGGTAKFEYDVETKSPLGNTGPTALDSFSSLPDDQTGFKVSKFSPENPKITLHPGPGNVSICIHDITSGDHDGGGTCSGPGSPGVLLDIVSVSSPQIQITDYAQGGVTVKPDNFTVNLNNPPPQSLSGVPPYTCPSAGIGVSPVKGTSDPFTVNVSMPPESKVPDGGCGFSVTDKFGNLIYASLTDDVPSSALRRAPR